jgi:O-antigen/teichoic acid export membrane protein
MINNHVHEVQKFTRDTVWTFSGLGFQSLAGLVTVALLTKSFHAGLYGVWAQISVTATLIVPLLNLGLDIAYIRFLAGEENREKLRHALGTVIWPALTIGCLTLTLSWFFRRSLSVAIFVNPEYITFVSLTFLWIFAQALFILSLCYYKALRRIKRAAVTQMSCATLQTAVLAILVINGFELIWVILSNVVIQGLFIVLSFGLIFIEVGIPTLNFHGLKNYLLFGIPILPSALLFWIMNSSAKYFITHILGISHTGIYSVSWSLVNFCSFFITPIAVNVFYTISGLWEKGEVQKVRRYLEYSNKVFLTLAIPGVVGMSILSQQLLKILTTSEFLTSEGLVLLLGIGIIFSGIYKINVYVIYLIKQTKWLPLILATASIISVGFNLVLIPRIGILGAAVSSVVSFFVLATIVTIWARRVIKYTVDSKFLVKVVTGSLVMALCLYFIRVDGVIGVILAIIVGTAIFGTALFLMRTFSTQERQLMRATISGLVPRLN